MKQSYDAVVDSTLAKWVKRDASCWSNWYVVKLVKFATSCHYFILRVNCQIALFKNFLDKKTFFNIVRGWEITLGVTHVLEIVFIIDFVKMEIFNRWSLRLALKLLGRACTCIFRMNRIVGNRFCLFCVNNLLFFFKVKLYTRQWWRHRRRVVLLLFFLECFYSFVFAL